MGLFGRLLNPQKRVDEKRDVQFTQGATVPPWGSAAWGNWGSWSFTSTNSVVGLTAVSAAIRVLAETEGLVPLHVYRGEPPNREKARDSWQWYRLHDKPNDDESADDFITNIGTSMEVQGNGFIWKAKSRPRPLSEEDIQLFLLDASSVQVKKVDGRKRFKVGNDPKLYGPDQIIHIRGWNPNATALEGASPITIHREAAGSALSLEEYQSRFYGNYATPGGAIVVPDAITQEQAKEMLDYWEQRHGGLANAHRPGILYNGATWQDIGVSQKDAQYIESKQWTLLEIARMFRISAIGMLGSVFMGLELSAKGDFERFLKVDLAPRFRRIELALKGDSDLFAPGGNMFPEFETNAILKPDIQSRMAAYKDAKQAGLMTANEIRELENLPPHADGDNLQQTPVGGAPNEGLQQGNGQVKPDAMAPVK